jgi:hypothetical protein
VAEYEINIQKSVAFLYTNNEPTEKEYRKAIPFIIIPQKTSTIKTKNHGRKKLKKTTEDGKISHSHGLAESVF